MEHIFYERFKQLPAEGKKDYNRSNSETVIKDNKVVSDTKQFII